MGSFVGRGVDFTTAGSGKEKGQGTNEPGLLAKGCGPLEPEHERTRKTRTADHIVGRRLA